MNSYERRAHFAHRFGTPLTTLNAGLELMERYLEDYQDDPRLAEILDLMKRAGLRLGSAVELLNQQIADRPDGIQITIPDELLLPQKSYGAVVALEDAPAPALEDETEASGAAHRTMLTVLLIEDSSMYRAVMSAHLQHHGYAVLTAPDGVAGLDLARKHRPDMIILDVMLPSLNGEDVAQVLTDDPETKHIPVVIYTSLEPDQINHLDSRLHIIRKDAALDNLPKVIEQVIAERQHSARYQLLLVEDDDETRQTLRIGLSEAGYTVTAAANGQEALRLAQHQPFDMVILDVVLPDINGFTVLQTLRERTQTATTPIMLLSALNSSQEKVRGFQLGADDYVTKPFDWSELLARIYASLRRRELEGSANPSTMLPGNRAIERAINARIEAHMPFAVAYCDLDNFKAYNDTYGFLKGDAIIHQTARIITHAVERYGSDGDFVGHIGGDDFVFITDPERIVPVCEAIIVEFDRLAPVFYDVESRLRGTINQYDREGNPKTFPLMSISIGVVSTLDHQISHFAQVGDLAADLKKRAKAQKGSVYLLEESS